MEITPEVLEKIREKFKTNSFPTLLGIEIDSIENGRSRLVMDVTEKHLQLQGIMHGGAIATLIDTAVAVAIIGASEPGARFTTIELKVNYLSPIREGRVYADAKLIRDGKRIVVAECDVFEPRGKLAARGLLTYMRLNQELSYSSIFNAETRSGGGSPG
ncbi:MAG: PaaI family thioesterase [Acidobacteriota bacterium]